MNRRDFLRGLSRIGTVTGLGLGYTTAGYTGFAAGSAVTAWYETRDLPYKPEGLAILISYGTLNFVDTALSYPGRLLVPMYVGRVEDAFGQRADIIQTGATKQNFYDALDDSGIHNIVLFGHGRWDSWYATDGIVTALDLHLRSPEKKSRLRGKHQEENIGSSFQKRGCLIRHTCGLDKIVDDSYFVIEEQDVKTMQREVQKVNEALRSVPGPIQLSVSLSTHYRIVSTKRLGEYAGFQLSYLFKSKNRITQKDTFGVVLIDHPRDLDSIETAVMKSIRELSERRLSELPISSSDWIKYIQVMISNLKPYLEKGFREHGWRNEVLGTPYFAPDKILGWSKRTTPLDFLINPLGNEHGNS